METTPKSILWIFCHTAKRGFRVSNIFDMTKENEAAKDLKNLVPNMLLGLSFCEPKRFKEIHDFFKTAFVELTSHDVFEETPFRNEWATYLSYLEGLAKPYEHFTAEEITTALEKAIKKLAKKEVSDV